MSNGFNLQERIFASIGDDFYLDRQEEKQIKEDAANRGYTLQQVEIELAALLDRHGAVSERALLDRLDALLHQYTDNDRRLDPEEERDALDQVVNPDASRNKRKGLDPRVAEEYVESFCRTRGIRRDTNRTSSVSPMALIAGVILIGGIAAYFAYKSLSGGNTAGKSIVAAVSGTVILSADDRARIDDAIRRAEDAVKAAEFTDPPQRSAKRWLDEISRIDPNADYRAAERSALTSQIIEAYIRFAKRDMSRKDELSARKWLDRARLFHAELEIIRDAEKELGLIPESDEQGP